MPPIYLFYTTQNFRRTRQQSVTGALGSWYRSRSSNLQSKIVIAGIIIFFIFSGFTVAGAYYDRSRAFLALTPTATTQQVVQSNNLTATTASQDTGATATVGATPTVIPTVTATPVPSPTHQSTPTPKPTQPPACQAVNNNPWCYNFSLGNLITNFPANFCSYFNCIPTFVSADDPDGGYIVECQDGTFSQSGGESGSCSHHGGNWRPLYSH